MLTLVVARAGFGSDYDARRDIFGHHWRSAGLPTERRQDAATGPRTRAPHGPCRSAARLPCRAQIAPSDGGTAGDAKRQQIRRIEHGSVDKAPL